MGVLHAIADVILILAALLAVVAFGFLAYAGFLIVRIVKQTKGTIDDVAEMGKQSMNEIRQTSRFVSTTIVKPASLFMGYATAVRATIKALTEDVERKARS